MSPLYTECDKGHTLECEGHDNWFCPICDKEMDND